MRTYSKLKNLTGLYFKTLRDINWKRWYQKTPQNLKEDTYQSRWGYHPCDYQTYLKLKKLTGLYFKTLRDIGSWKRWYRKAPQNRVIRQHIRDSKGDKIGYNIVGPRPEPELCPIFSKKEKVKTWNGKTVECVRSINREVIYDYKNARKPQKSKQNVKQLRFSVEEINRLYEKIEPGECDR